jgi:hypothetical protein
MISPIVRLLPDVLASEVAAIDLTGMRGAEVNATVSVAE